MPLPNPSMSFTPLDPLPASELNDMVENIEALADGSGLDDGAVTAPKLDANAIGHGFIEIARTTLGSAGDTITVNSIPAYKYLKIIFFAIPSGSIGGAIRFNNDSSANYADRLAANGAADTGGGSQTSAIFRGGTGTHPTFTTCEITNIATIEKIGVIQAISAVAGAANQPNRVEGVIKWANTSNQINRIDVINTSTGDFAAGSEVIVFGKN